ncbi:MAG TPA: Type 1 glutamine amidotransferase-like domain-containing protein [Candidatus Saccharimonadales bacterium]|jgi:hypothetical protein
MTKYILVGGADRKYVAYAQAFAEEVRKTAAGPLKVLSCLFAEPRETWEDKFAIRESWFKETLGEDTEVRLAFPDKFAQQCAWADIIYLHGGDDTLLSCYLDRAGDLSELWQGKIVVGTSAGANYLAKSYWTCDWRQTRGGSGLVDLNVIPHFESKEYGKADPRGPIDWGAARAELQHSLGAGERVTPLPEGHFVVIEA